MTQKTTILFIFALSLISILSFNVFSVTEDFIALAQNSSITACSCTIVENSIKIGNTGDINSLYSISQKGEAAPWSIIMPKSFSLDEKNIKTLTNPINVPCDARVGEYDLFTYIETGFGLNKVISQKVVVEKCEIAEEKQTPKVNETANIKINQSIKPANNTITQNLTNEEETVKDELDNIDITIPEIKEVCGCNKTLTYPITAKSKAADTIKTTIEGPAFASLGWNSPKDMAANDEFSFDLNLNLSCDEELGKKTIKLITESLNTSKREEHIIEFELKKDGECDKMSPGLINIIKWVTYIVAAFVIIAIIAIIILYRSESDDKVVLESKPKKTTKKASKKKRK